MANLANQAQPAIEKLMGYEEEDLFLELGTRLRAMRLDPNASASFDLEVTPSVEVYGPLDDLRNFGQHFFKRLNKQAFELVCGSDAEDSQERKSLVEAFSISRDTVAAALAALLVAYLGLAPAIAVVVSAITIKLFFSSTHGAMCDVWESKLPK